MLYHQMKNLKLIITVIMSTLILSCSKDSNNSSPAENGGNTSASGSLSLFTKYGNFLYKVENSTLKIYDIGDATQPTFVNEIKLEEPVETIMANEYLYFGTETGLLIYSLASPTTPTFISKYRHVVSCDPVVVKGNYAFVTLSAQSRCRGVNELHVVDISNIRNPTVERIYPFSNPQGMAIADDYLYLCEGKFGLKVLDISNVNQITTVAKINTIHAVDAIYQNDILTVRGPSGVYRYDCANRTELKEISYTGR